MKKWIRLWAVILAVFLLGACGRTEAQPLEASDVREQETAEETEAVENRETEAEEEASEALRSETSGSEDSGEEALLEEPEEDPAKAEGTETAGLPKDGTYTSKEEVAEYIHQYGHLPDNFITKKEAQALGWEGGSLEPYAPGMCIGGSRFGNYEGLLPEAEGRTYTECDIDTLGSDRRGAKRIVFSNDGLIYYTEDHYETFELLYGEES